MQSYAQEGEDLVLNAFLDDRSYGFYVDIGSLHPHRFSNTNFFYERGWRGINIEPRPGSKALFDQHRSRDINLELGISSTPGSITYYEFSEPALNTFSEERKNYVLSLDRYKLIGEKQVEVKGLAEVLAAYMPDDQPIDFMSIDVEGLDEDVLRSNDWKRFSPGFLLVEISNQLTEMDSIGEYLMGVGYIKVANTLRTGIYKLQNS